MKRAFTQGEVLVDAVIHGAGIALSIVGPCWLVSSSIDQVATSQLLALLVYSVAAVSMLSFSAANNVVQAASWKGTLRRFDQAAIYIMIAGTYSPIAVAVASPPAYALLSIVWGVALVGVTSKLLIDRPWDRLSLLSYLVLGWSGLIVGPSLGAALPRIVIELLFAGGLLYSLGVIFHVWRRLPYQNAIWHLFVLAAAICHFFAIALASVAAGPPVDPAV